MKKIKIFLLIATIFFCNIKISASLVQKYSSYSTIYQKLKSGIKRFNELERKFFNKLVCAYDGEELTEQEILIPRCLSLLISLSASTSCKDLSFKGKIGWFLFFYFYTNCLYREMEACSKYD